MTLHSVPARTTSKTLTHPDLGRYCTAAEKRALLGRPEPDSRSRGQYERNACRVLGIRFNQRRIPLPHGRGHTMLDECEVWIDDYVQALLSIG